MIPRVAEIDLWGLRILRGLRRPAVRPHRLSDSSPKERRGAPSQPRVFSKKKRPTSSKHKLMTTACSEALEAQKGILWRSLST